LKINVFAGLLVFKSLNFRSDVYDKFTYIQQVDYAARVCPGPGKRLYNLLKIPERIKKRQATHIAPLQPLILAAFRPWGGSVGAGRMRPAAAKIGNKTPESMRQKAKAQE